MKLFRKRVKPIVHKGVLSIKDGQWLVDRVFPLCKEDVDKIDGYDEIFDNVKDKLIGYPRVNFILEDNVEEGTVYARMI